MNLRFVALAVPLIALCLGGCVDSLATVPDPSLSARDAEYLAEHIKARARLAPAERKAALNEAAIGS